MKIRLRLRLFFSLNLFYNKNNKRSLKRCSGWRYIMSLNPDSITIRLRKYGFPKPSNANALFNYNYDKLILCQCFDRYHSKLKRILNFQSPLAKLVNIPPFAGDNATWYGKQMIAVSNTFTFSQLCSACGYQNKEVKQKHIRQWMCPSYGAIHVRDRNLGIIFLPKIRYEWHPSERRLA